MANGNRTNKVNTSMSRRTELLKILCGIFAFIVLAIELYTIQIRDHDLYEGEAVEQQTLETKITAARGTIYDRNMNILAMSASTETVYIDPYRIEEQNQDVELIASGLSEILGVDRDSVIEKAADTRMRYKIIATKVEEELINELSAFIKQYGIKGIETEPDSKRYYPYSTLASNIIGFVDTDGKGIEGLESCYNEILTGRSGAIITAKNARGTSLLYDYENYFDAEDGKSLILTIDTTVQFYLEKYLQEGIDEYQVENGAIAIAMNVNTGEILGLASLPNYDLNDHAKVYDEDTADYIESIISDNPPAEYADMTYEERLDAYNEQTAAARLKQWRSKAVSDTYEPGSTFKIFTLAMAIEEGLADENADYYCGGYLAAGTIPGRDTPLYCSNHSGHGAQTLTQAVQHSCNVAFVKLGLRIGARTFYKYVEAFGFFDKTGIDLEGEGSSLWWDEDVFCSANQSSLASASFGQTFNITPLQLITAVSCVANGGRLMKPYVVSSVLDSEGNTVESTEPTVVRRVISEATSERCCEILEKVVGDQTEGTGKNAYIAGYRIAGKTGTGEKIGQNSDDYVVSFVGFAPADDPQIAVLVAYDSPSDSSGYYISGGGMAAPTVRKIFEDILPYLGIEPSYTESELSLVDVNVPKLTGYELDEACAELENAGLEYRIIGAGGTVTDQIPASGSHIQGSSTVVLYTEGSADTGEVIVPDVIGLDRSTAMQRLEDAGLYMRSTGTSSSLSTVVAVSQSETAYESVPIGTVVEVNFVDNSIRD